MTLNALCRQMSRQDCEADLKRRGAELDSWLRRFLAWGRRR